jgi:6-phosphogluconolactonase (cycloisomerase 2 family)
VLERLSDYESREAVSVGLGVMPRGLRVAAACVRRARPARWRQRRVQPRGIKIDPSGEYLVASGEKSDRLSVYKIGQSTGKLSEPSRYPVGNGANWVEIVDLP